MLRGMSIAQLPADAILHETKVRVPNEILLSDDYKDAEGYLVENMGKWYISPEPPANQDRKLYLLAMQLCDNPMEQIVVA